MQNKSWVLFGFCIIILNHNSDKAKLKWQHFFMLSKSVYEWHINQHAMSTCFYGICIITTIDATSTTCFDSLISKQSKISAQWWRFHKILNAHIERRAHGFYAMPHLTFFTFSGLKFCEIFKIIKWTVCAQVDIFFRK